MTNERLARLRGGFLSATLLSGLAAIAAPAQAQIEAAPSAGADLASDEAIVITGSRLQRDANLGSPSPIVTIEEEAFLGSSDATEVLRSVPALSASVSAASSLDPGENGAGGAAGQAFLNLRGLGPERTLTLVNGRRHVAGVAESAIVDINSIPTSLIENVEVLTGGASAVYGADAVTGVVNFILDEDYDGLELGIEGGLNGDGNGQRLDVYGKFGKNFNDGRGNITLAVDYHRDEGLKFGETVYADGMIAADGSNPFLRFQAGDIGAETPNFAQFYSLDNGYYPSGFRIPQTAADFLDQYEATFGSRPSLTAAEQALIDQAANAPTRYIAPQYQFNITSNGGLVIPGDFLDPMTDIDNNGQSDCLQSFVGYNGLFDYSQAFGLAGGCYILTDDGPQPINDGLIAGNFNAFGGDGVIFDNDGFLTPQIDRISFNLLSRYEFSRQAELFFEAKYVRQETYFGTTQNSYYDLLRVSADNPFIPAVLQDVADTHDGLYITRDPTDLGPNKDTNISETYRFVGGIEGEFPNGFSYELSANYGRYELETINRNNVLLDRFFAAIDVTTDANGNPVCRSEIDPTVRSPSTIFGIPTGEFGYLTFVPGSGECVPANILGGPQSISQEAVDFITTTTRNNYTTEQLDIFGIVVGDTDDFLMLPYDGLDFALGFEFRDEASRSEFDPLVRGILPVTTVDGNAGDFVGDLGFSQTSLATPPDQFLQNSGGGYSVFELFGELGTTIIEDEPFFHELRVEGAARYSDYTTVGGVFTWAVNGFWAPVEDVRFRGTYSRAVRAPNIAELYAPPQAAFFRPFDPCDATEIARLQADGYENIDNRIANCAAAGIPSDFVDPLSARFAGTISGNPDLREETADTFTVGAVLQPRFVPGLALTVDYYDIKIDDAISTLDSQDVVDNCYDSAEFPNDFCDSFTRNQDPSSPQYLGFTSLTLQSINFVSIETAGIDASASYNLMVGEFDIGLSATASWVDKLDFFFDPTDDTAIDNELGEIQRPEWSGRGTASLGYGPFKLSYTLKYFGEQALGDVEIDTYRAQFGEAGLVDEFFVHDIAASVDIVEDQFSIYGGINNLTDEDPFITERSYPVSALGRFFFLGARWSM
ncbi:MULTISPECIES: TonB-dependent receptor domain-containing protein [Pacificimonas]|nr:MULTISPECIES: TonB-dependent receptor [Pacificimonas]MBZ6379632.1 TonB-dependent receptor [Pacificimonas aurantium]